MSFTQKAYVRLGLSLLGFGFAALLFVCGTSLWLIRQNRDHAALVAHSQDVQTRLAELRWLARAAETGQRGFLLTLDPAYLKPFETSRVRLPADLDDLAAFVSDNPEQSARIAPLRDLVDRKLTELASTVTLAQGGASDQALDLVKTGVGHAYMEGIDAQLDAMEATEARLRETRDATYEAGNRAAFFSALFGTILVVVTAGAVAWATRRYLRELGQAQDALAEANAGLERRVAERTAALSEANTEIQRFAYIVSHDLRSPLVNVMGFTSELEAVLGVLRRLIDTVAARMPDLLDPAAREAVDQDLPEAIGFIRASTLKMDRLIKAILKLSREGRRVLTPERLDLAELVHGIADSMKTVVEERQAVLAIEALPVVVSDRLAVEQILSNLIENAVKYLSPDRPGRVTVRGRATGPQILIDVADNGRGIDSKDDERIFELFRRAGTQDQPGEGIGLAHVRTLARRLGGTVECRSELGVGSTFTLSLPRKLRPQSEGFAA